MRNWAAWYRYLVVVWFVIGVPSLVIGYGFSGGDLEIPTPATAGVVSFFIWLACVAFLLSPVLLWPARRCGRQTGFY
jgi:hypothetical protein